MIAGLEKLAAEVPLLELGPRFFGLYEAVALRADATSRRPSEVTA